MAEPSVSSQPLLVQPTAPTWLERLEIWLEQLFVTIGLLYSRHYLLTAQLLLSFAAAAFCGFQINNKTYEFQASIRITLFMGLIYLFSLGIFSLVMDALKNWFRGRIAKYWVFYYGLRAFGIGGLLKVCIFFSDLLGSQKNLDGYVTGFFLFSYLHVVSFTKLLKIQDEVCLSDSLMAMALLIATRLDSKENLVRSIASYGSAYVLICFRYSTVPYEKEAQDISTTTHSSEMVVIDTPPYTAIDLDNQLTDDATEPNTEETEQSLQTSQPTGGESQGSLPNTADDATGNTEPNIEETEQFEPDLQPAQPTGGESQGNLPNTADDATSNTEPNTEETEQSELDSSRVQPAMASIAASREADLNAKRLREEADVDIIANELELDKDVVKKVLREHKGDAVAATRDMLNRLEEFRRLG